MAARTRSNRARSSPTHGLPAGCTTDAFANPAEVTSISCPALVGGAGFGAFTNLTSLEIGRPGTAQSPSLTRIPVLPASLKNLSVSAARVANFDAVAKLPALESLHIQGSTVTNLGLLAANLKLSTLSLDAPGYWGKDLTPLARTGNLEDLSVRGTARPLSGAEDVWDGRRVRQRHRGKVLLPDNAPLLNDAGKPSGRLTYSYDAKNRQGQIQRRGHMDGHRPAQNCAEVGQSDRRTTRSEAKCVDIVSTPL